MLKGVLNFYFPRNYWLTKFCGTFLEEEGTYFGLHPGSMFSSFGLF